MIRIEHLFKEFFRKCSQDFHGISIKQLDCEKKEDELVLSFPLQNLSLHCILMNYEDFSAGWRQIQIVMPKCFNSLAFEGKYFPLLSELKVKRAALMIKSLLMHFSCCKCSAEALYCLLLFICQH